MSFDWLKLAVYISITVWKTWKKVHTIIRHRIYYHEQYGEFMLWYKEDYFYILVFNKSISPRVSRRYKNACGSLGELEIVCKHSPYGLHLVFPFQFRVLPNFHTCFYNCMKTRKMFSIS